MPTVKSRGEAVAIHGDLPAVGKKAPEFFLTNQELNEVNADAFSNEIIVLNIFPSIDTPTCQMSVRNFNKKAGGMHKVKVVNVSYDLPFAQSRFCAAEGLENVINLSCFRSSFAETYGIKIKEGKLRGLCARAVVIIDQYQQVAYTQLVDDISSEPDYDSALQAVEKLQS